MAEQTTKKQPVAAPTASEPVARSVFISSTFSDLAEHRQAVWNVLEKFEVTVRGMERFGAQTRAPIETCLAEVEQSDVYVGVIGFRLGSLEKASGKSFTQLEYERAEALGRPVLIYIADEEEARVRHADIDVDPTTRARLVAFKTLLRDRHTVSSFTTVEDLAQKVRTDFAKYLRPRPTAVDPGTSEYDEAVSLVRRFFLVPKTVEGYEIRLQIRFHSQVFPVARDLCKAFNFEYGHTVCSGITILQPESAEVRQFQYLYATGRYVDQFLKLADQKGPFDIYARLQFTERDIHRLRAEFIGRFAYYDGSGDDPDDPREIYVPPEGQSILVFSKTAK